MGIQITKQIISTCMLLSLSNGAVNAVSAHAKSSTGLLVWPRSAGKLAPISLSDLIARAIPARGQMGWDHLQIANVQWITEGIEFTGTGNSNRIGYARVRAAGTASKMLRQKWEELAWSVELSTDGNAKWGPDLLTIRPGFDNSRFKGAYICFGTGFEGCAFPLAALKSPKIQFIEHCELGEGANVSKVLSAVTTDGRRGTVIYSGSGGSGGYSTSVSISTLSPSDYCTTYKDRGY